MTYRCMPVTNERGKTRNVNVALERMYFNLIDGLARKRNVSRTQIVREIVVAYFGKFVPASD